MIKSLRKKFIVITMLMVSLVLLAVFVGICLYFTHNLRQDSYRTLESAMNKPHDEKSPDFQIGDGAPNGFTREPTFVVSVDSDGTVSLIDADRVNVDNETLDQVTALALQSDKQTGQLNAYDLRFMINKSGDETKIAFITMSFEKEEIKNIVIVTGLAIAGAFAVFFIASVLLARRALTPVEQAWQRQRRFVADASHELKTPLTVILANLGILQGNPQQTIEQQINWVNNTQQEAQRMKGLVNDLLFLAKADNTSIEGAMETVSLSDCITTSALSFEPVAFEQGVSLEADIESGIIIMGHKSQIEQLIGILLDNAVKYGAKNGIVFIRLHHRQGNAELSVRNQGAPISEEDQKNIFERFFRVDASRSESGYGLGLSIAKAIVDKHKGKISVTSNTKDTVFTVLIPSLH